MLYLFLLTAQSECRGCSCSLLSQSVVVVPAHCPIRIAVVVPAHCPVKDAVVVSAHCSVTVVVVPAHCSVTVVVVPAHCMSGLV